MSGKWWRRALWAGLVTWVAACGRGGSSELDPGAPVGSPGPAKRVLPTNAAAVDFVLDLVEPERIVALPDTVDEFANVAIDPARFGPERRFHEFTAEVLLGFRPDLVIVSPWQGQDTIDRLGEAGVRVLELKPVETLDDIRDLLTVLGAELGVPERAAAKLAEFDRRVLALREAAEARPAWKAVSYTNYGSGGWAAGSGSTADLVLGLAGLVNQAKEAGRVGHDSVDIETLLTWDPDWIVVSRPSETYGATRAFLEGESALRGLACLREGRIAEVPANLYSTTSHFLVEAAEALAAELDTYAAR